MKTLTIAALVAAQVLTIAQPAAAADFTDSRIQEMGGFAGLRMRVALDGNARQQRVRAGLTVAPMIRSTSQSGEARTRFGEGIELGVTGREPLRMSLAGTPLSRLGQAPGQSHDRKLGVSTIAWVAIGVGVLVGAVLIAGQLCVDGEICGSE